MEACYRVRNWKQFQHYNRPRPAWIKLHRQLLDDRDFQGLSNNSRALLVMLWLMAAESPDGTIPGHEAIAWRLRMSVSEVSKHIRDLTNYLEPLYTDSRAPLVSEEKRRDRDRDREETEREAKILEPVYIPKKRPFAPHVFLTDLEHQKLVDTHGQEATDWMIQKLDAWKEGKGLTGNSKGSDSAKIRSWVVDAWHQHRSRIATAPEQPAAEALAFIGRKQA